MDSITQFALGSAVALVTVGRRSLPRHAAWKVALIGGMVGTLPDLDAFIDFGDAISNMIRHRAETHGLFYLTLVSPILGLLVARLQGQAERTLRWTLAVWLVLVTHVGIDYLTIYGTQLLQPFSDYPLGLGSMFVIDPLYTVPIILGVAVTVISRRASRWRWNNMGIALSSAYVLWGLGVHQYAVALAEQHPPVTDQSTKILVTAAPLNTVLWRAVAVTPDAYYEGWYSLLDKKPQFTWQKISLDPEQRDRYANHPDVIRVTQFSHGFYRVDVKASRLFVTDLRLGLEPFYSFRFDLGPTDQVEKSRSERVGVRPDLGAGLPWLWQRILGNPESLQEFIQRRESLKG
jgi:inner membrane protein